MQEKVLAKCKCQVRITQQLVPGALGFNRKLLFIYRSIKLMTMQDSTICNAKVARAGENYYLNLRGSNGTNCTIEIQERQAIKVLQDLEITLRDYNSESVDKEKPTAGIDVREDDEDF